MPGFVTQTQTICPICRGKGKTIHKKCHKCNGNKLHDINESMTLSIPRSAK